MPPRRIPLVAILCLALLEGCGPSLRSTAVRFLSRQAPPPDRVLRDVPYRPGSGDPKHRLDLFLPADEGWPVLVFVHGGGWDQGDKDLSVGGVDVYGNIGRFYAGRGVGVAVANYRLQPDTDWRGQVDDVAHAVAWVHANVERYGGDPTKLFLAGHSAGAQIVAYVALDAATLERAGAPRAAPCGVIPVSGAAFDMTDKRTYEIGADRDYLEERFRLDDSDDDWMRTASPVTYLTPSAPPFLLLFGAYEWKALAYQNRLLADELRIAGVPVEVEIFREFHPTIVLSLARDKPPARAVLEFIRASSCS